MLAVGKGKITDDGKVHSLEVKTGDRILYGKYSGTPFQLGGDEVIIIKASDVLAKIS